MTDARYEDGAETPLALRAETPEDLAVIAALVQDAVLPASEIRWDRRRRRLALLINRFRWEDRATAERQRRRYERVQAVLAIDDVTAVASQGFRRGDSDVVLSLLTLTFEPGADGTGTLTLILAGDGAIRLSVECLALALCDVTRPYLAPSRRAPAHPGT